MFLFLYTNTLLGNEWQAKVMFQHVLQILRAKLTKNPQSTKSAAWFFVDNVQYKPIS